MTDRTAVSVAFTVIPVNDGLKLKLHPSSKNVVTGSENSVSIEIIDKLFVKLFTILSFTVCF